MQQFSFKQVAAALAFVGLGATQASAAMVTLTGDNIDVVYDDTQASLSFFGGPTLVGDLITFSPSNFKAVAAQGSIDFAGHTVNLKIVLHDGYRIQSIATSEGGDYFMWNNTSFVNVGGQTRVFDTAQLPPGLVTSLTPSGLGTVVPVGSLTTTNWTATADSDLSGAAYASTRELSYSLQNLLVAYADKPGLDPSLALIEKKFVAIDMSVSPVPEAETWAMMLVGVGLVGFRLRSKSKKAAATRLI